MEQVKERQDEKNGILLTPEDIARVFNVDVSTVKGWVNDELLAAIFIPPRYDMRFSLYAICKFVNEHQTIWTRNFKLDD